jgi:hypothetical protein
VINQQSRGFATAAAISAWVVLIVAFSTVLVGEILDFGLFERSESFHGPFERESPEATSQCFVVAVGTSSRLGKLFTTSGDTPNDPYRSNLKLWINGQTAGPPHTFHEEIRKQGSGRYSHWGDVLLFSLPAGIRNEPTTTALVQYSPKLDTRISSLGGLALVLSAGFLVLRVWRLDPVRVQRKAPLLGRSAGALCLALFAATTILTAIYLVTIAIGVVQGYSLPNTALFRLLPWTREIAIHEPAAQYVIALVAMVGAVLSWLAPSAFRNHEPQLIRYWNRYGLLFIATFFLFSLGATWSGIARREDLQSSAMGGLLPFNDAHGYFDMAFSQVITGHWGPLMEQRPFAAGHRTLLMFLADYSNVRYLLLQALVLASVTYAATRAVMLWRGVWAGLTFFGLILASIRPYLPTHLTEPFGQFWALLSVPFVIRLLRHGAFMDGAVSFLGTTMSLLTRMGSMFTIPALAIWLTWTQSRDAKRLKPALLTITAVLLGCSLLSVLLLRLYGSGSGVVGSNFSSVICGATHGGDWTKCESLYEADLRKVGPGFGAGQAHYLYAKAWEGFRRDPSVLFRRMIEGERVFFGNLVTVALGGYTTRTIPRWFSQRAWTMIVVFGLLVTFWRQRERRELSFWLFMWAGLLASAPLVIFADGWRVLSSVFPFLALFFACGFATPADVVVPVPPTESRAPKLALVGLVVTMLLWIVIPGLVHWLDLVGSQAFKTVTSNPGERVVLGSTHMAGFVVVPDDAPVPTDVPSMRRSEFTRAFEYSGNESYQKLMLPPSSTSFAFIAAPNTNGTRGNLFLAPPEVLSRRDVPAWRLTVEDPFTEERVYWFRVSAATPLALAPK